jgi:hypothetical protein
MKHEFIGEPISLSSYISEITLKLLPENEIEAMAIKNSEAIQASKAESELISKYLLINITGWSILSIKSQDGAIFKLEASGI